MASARFILGVALSAGVHVLAYVQMSHAKANVAPPKPAVVIEVDTSVPPPPPPEPKPAETKPSAEPAPIAKSEKPVMKPSANPPPSAAQAGKVLAAEKDDGPADFTMVQGAGVYAGGITSSTGTSKTAVTAQPRIAAAVGPATGGGGNGNGTGPDRSKPARPVGSDWDCSSMFPSAATVDTATVVIVARVRPDGSPEAITVVTDPGQGFGKAAKSCAMRQRYAAAEDREGRAIAASTAPFRVRFTR
jgi:periplasmic protein TonB